MEGYSELTLFLSQPTTKRLDKEFRLVLDKQHEINLRSSALSELRQRVVQGHEIVRRVLASTPSCTHAFLHRQRNIIDVYEKSVHPTLENYASKTSRQKYMENEEYISFRNLIWVRPCLPSLPPCSLLKPAQENLYDGRAVPNIKKMIPAGPSPSAHPSSSHSRLPSQSPTTRKTRTTRSRSEPNKPTSAVP